MTGTAVEFLLGLLVGLSGGASSGLLGVSPGGALTVFSALLMGAEQHAAQGLSLTAQIPPTALAGLRPLSRSRRRIPKTLAGAVILGFVAGGFAGAAAAASLSAAALRWSYVAYLVALDALLILRRPAGEEVDAARQVDASLSTPALFAVGGIRWTFIWVSRHRRRSRRIVAGLGAGLGVPKGARKWSPSR